MAYPLKGVHCEITQYTGFIHAAEDPFILHLSTFPFVNFLVHSPHFFPNFFFFTMDFIADLAESYDRLKL